MSAPKLLRWSGLAANLCGVLLPLSWILEVVFGFPPSDLIDTIYFVGLIFLVFGLMGIYGSQVVETGVFGFLGFLLTILTTCLAISGNWLPENMEAGGVVGLILPLMAFSGLIGYTLLGIGSWKANKFPRWTAVLWPTGWLVALISMALVMSGFGFAEYLHVFAFVLWALGFMRAGVMLLSVTIEPSLEPVAAT